MATLDMQFYLIPFYASFKRKGDARVYVRCDLVRDDDAYYIDDDLFTRYVHVANSEIVTWLDAPEKDAP